MDKSLIVIWVNVAYSVVYLIAWTIRFFENGDNVRNSKPNDIEYFAYSGAGAFVVAIVAITLIRNSFVFNNWFPISFIVQFSVQFILLVCFILPDKKVLRYVASHIVLFFLIFALLNGLYRKDPKYSKVELTQLEIESLSRDANEFAKDLTSRIKKVNEDMNAVLLEVRKRDEQVKAINELLKAKQSEYKEISAVIQVDREKAEEILTVFNVHRPTIYDRILDGFIGAFFGLFLTFAWKWILKRRKTPIVSAE